MCVWTTLDFKIIFNKTIFCKIYRVPAPLWSTHVPEFSTQNGKNCLQSCRSFEGLGYPQWVIQCLYIYIYPIRMHCLQTRRPTGGYMILDSFDYFLCFHDYVLFLLTSSIKNNAVIYSGNTSLCTLQNLFLSWTNLKMQNVH